MSLSSPREVVPIGAAHAHAPEITGLTLLDYASLSMGLELLPHRADEVLRSFGLDATSGAQTLQSWSAHLETHPREAAELANMRERMRAHWTRWDATTRSQTHLVAVPKSSPAPSPSSPASTSAPSSASEPATNEVSRRLCFADFASLTMGIEVHHRHVEAVWASFGFLTSRQRRTEELAWIAHLRGSPDELGRLRRDREDTRAGWTRWAPYGSTPVPARKPRRPYRAPVRFRPAELDAPLDLLGELGVRKPPPRPTRLVLVEYASLRMLLEETPHLRVQHGAAFGLSPAELDQEVASWTAILAEHLGQAESYDRIRAELQASRARPSVPPPAHRPPTKKLELLEYAVLCAELDRAGADEATVLRRHGVTGADELAGIHEHWQTRFTEHPAEREEWFRHLQRLRTNWTRPIR